MPIIKGHPVMVEDKEYSVTLTLRISTNIWFAAIEREGPIMPSDAINNAIGTIPEGVFDLLEGEGFEIAYPIDGEATEL